MVHKACSLRHKPALIQHDKIGDTTNVESRSQLGITLRVDLDDDGVARHPHRHACDLGRRHAAGSAPVCPEVYEYRNPRVMHDVVELLRIDFHRLINRPKRSLAGSAPAAIRNVPCWNSVLSRTRLARPDNAYKAPLSPLKL